MIEEAERRGLVLVSEPLSDVVQDSGGGYVVIDPVDIRLTFRAKPGLALAGRALRWCPLDGWSIARSQLDPPARYLAAPGGDTVGARAHRGQCHRLGMRAAGRDGRATRSGWSSTTTPRPSTGSWPFDRKHPVSLHQTYLPGPATATGERADHMPTASPPDHAPIT